MEKRIETLLAEKGRKFEETGEAIASIRESKRQIHIVFLPKGAEPGKYVRVELCEIREDSRGNMMYRGVPAPVEYSDCWKDNGDGTISRVTIATTWLLEKNEEGVVETRPTQTREGSPSTRSNFQVVWGHDLESSTVEDRQVKVTPIERETVVNGQISWQKFDERQEALPVQSFVTAKVVTNEWCQWHNKRLDINYAQETEVKFSITYKLVGTLHKILGNKSAWAEMPEWWRQEQEKKLPICDCGRQRIDSSNTEDGYTKCEICRSEEVCDRCKKQKKIQIFQNLKVCESCKPLQEEENLVDERVPPAKRAQISTLASKLAAGQAFSQEVGMIILTSQLDHIDGDYDRQQLISAWKKYPQLYLCEDGWYGTKFYPEGLQVLKYYDQAKGDGLLELTAWLMGYSNIDQNDYYIQSQQSKTSPARPTIQKWSLENDFGLAKKIRGTESDRKECLEALKLFPDCSFPLVEELKSCLKSKNQDYSACCQLAKEIQKVNQEKNQGSILINFSVNYRRGGATRQADAWVVTADGELRLPDAGEKAWSLVRPSELALQYKKANTADNHHCEVVKLPVDGCTDSQLRAVRQIETDDLGVIAGAFGLDPDFNRLCKERLAAAKKAHDSLPHDLRAPEGWGKEWDFFSLCSQSGIWLREEGSFTSRINFGADFSEYCESREAQIIHSVPCCQNGMLELLAYDKFGAMQLNMRWRELTDEEAQKATSSQTPVPDSPPADLSKVDLSQLFGGNARTKR